jgi:hypothetical protein
VSLNKNHEPAHRSIEERTAAVLVDFRPKMRRDLHYCRTAFLYRESWGSQLGRFNAYLYFEKLGDTVMTGAKWEQSERLSCVSRALTFRPRRLGWRRSRDTLPCPSSLPPAFSPLPVFGLSGARPCALHCEGAIGPGEARGVNQCNRCWRPLLRASSGRILRVKASIIATLLMWGQSRHRHVV